jgi:cytochrome b561
MSTKTRYDLSQIVLHWLIAILIAVNWFLGDAMNHAFRDLLRTNGTSALDSGANAHRLIGISVIVLVLLRVVVRLIRKGPPEAPGSKAMQLGAKVGHLALYVLMLAVPVTGYLSYSNLDRNMGGIHGAVTNLLLIVAFGHAILAFYHHYVLKDGLLYRMFPGKQA